MSPPESPAAPTAPLGGAPRRAAQVLPPSILRNESRWIVRGIVGTGLASTEVCSHPLAEHTCPTSAEIRALNSIEVMHSTGDERRPHFWTRRVRIPHKLFLGPRLREAH